MTHPPPSFSHHFPIIFASFPGWRVIYHTCRYAYHLISSYWRLHPLHVPRILSMSWLPHVVQTVPQWLPASSYRTAIHLEILPRPTSGVSTAKSSTGESSPAKSGWRMRTSPTKKLGLKGSEIRKKPTQDTLKPTQGQSGKHWKTKT